VKTVDELDLGLDGAVNIANPHPRQWRLNAVELVNWGTFDGLHRADISRQGHLITGHSGSGKSSLLDAIATVLTPPKWRRFNAAAQDSSNIRDDRSLVSYVRGAWRRQTDDETGEAVSQYLRPGATWSGILLRYEGAEGAEPVNLIRLFHIRKSSNSSDDLRELNVIRRGDVHLTDFTDFVRNGIEVRQIKAQWDDAVVTDQHSAFSARFRGLLGIASENALQLLHKTQSAKNLGSLDQLFRSFMLEEPRTSALADTAVTQFGELSEAHRLVVEARKQVELLEQLRQPIADYRGGLAAQRAAEKLSAALFDYRDMRALERDRKERESLRELQAKADEAVREASEQASTARNERVTAQLRMQQVGGDALESQRLLVEHAREELHRVFSLRTRTAISLNEIGVAMPESAEQLEELRSAARRERDNVASSDASAKQALNDLHRERVTAQNEVRNLESELTELRARPSNIDQRLLRARALIATSASMVESALPFAGELMDVDPKFASWTGAIERVLRPLATVLLVPESQVGIITRIVDSLHLGARLVYEAVPTRNPSPLPTRSNRSLVNRVIVEASPMGAWVARRLSERFDFECVDNTDDLSTVDRGVTVAGQVKHSARSFEKDDRFAVNDRARWILGSDNAGKVEHYMSALAAAELRLRTAEHSLDEVTGAQSARQRRTLVLENLDALVWSEVNVDAASAALQSAEAVYQKLTEGNVDLQNARDFAEQARTRDEEAVEHQSTVRSQFDALVARCVELDDAISDRAAREPLWHLDAETVGALDRLFRSVGRSNARIEDSAAEVATRLGADERAGSEQAQTAIRRFEFLAGEFRRSWALAAADLSTSMDDADGYVALLTRIVSTGLPAHEGRFFDLLREQSQQLTGQLLSEIRGAPSQIRGRIDPVNVSLRRSPFDEGRYLQIRVKDRRTEEVKKFMSDLQSISAGAWADDDRASAEHRFALLQDVMHRLGSAEHRQWRNRCLDTREHVTFLGIEEDSDGHEVNVHDSSAGLSGGQRQKLVIFCLAAALRYQLAEDEDDIPNYGTIVLDEAFDKADSDFTRMAMDVFLEFGFHMILATPLKLLQTLEDYVGGISFITCKDHNDSHISVVPIELAPLAEPRRP
jgi:uncharacterized protein YPO0396